MPYSGTVGKELSKLLHIPVDHYGDVLRVLELEHYGAVLGCLDYAGRTAACAYVLASAADTRRVLPTREVTEALLVLLRPLVADQEDSPQDAPLGEDFRDQQNLVARLVSLMQAENADQQYLVSPRVGLLSLAACPATVLILARRQNPCL